MKLPLPSDYYTEEDIARHDVIAKLEATNLRLDAEIAAKTIAQNNGENKERESYINELIEGKDASPPKTSAAQVNELRQQKLGVEQALDVLARKDSLAETEAKKRLCRDLEAQSYSLGKQQAESLAAAHKIHVEYFKIKRHLLGNSIGLHGGVFSADVEQFLGIPSDKAGALADYFRDAVKAGYLKNLPEALR
jgi:hypothetical protein